MSINLNSTGVRNLIKHTKSTEGKWGMQKSSSLETIRDFAQQLNTNEKKEKLSLIIECSHLLLRKGSLLFGGNTPLNKESLINQLRELKPDKTYNDLSILAKAIEKLVTHKHETFDRKTSTTKSMNHLFQENTRDNQLDIPNKYRQIFANNRNYSELRQIVQDYQVVDYSNQRYNLDHKSHQNRYEQNPLMQEAHDMIHLLMISTDIEQITQQAERQILIKINDKLPHEIKTKINAQDNNIKVRKLINENITSGFNSQQETINSQNIRISSLQTALTQLEDAQDTLIAELDKQKEKNARLQDQIFEIEGNLNKTEKELNLQNEKYQNLMQTTQSEKSNLTKTIDNLIISNNKLTEDKQQLTFDKQKLEHKIDRLIQDIDNLEQLKAQITEDFTVAQNQINKLEMQIKFNDSQIKKYSFKINKLKQARAMLQEAHAQSQTKLEKQNKLLLLAKDAVGDLTNTVARNTIIETGSEQSNELSSTPIYFQSADTENDNSFIQDRQSQFSYNRSNAMSTLNKSQIFIEALDNHIAQDKQNNLPGGFIQLIEYKKSKYLVNKYDGVDEMRNALNEMHNNQGILASLGNKQESIEAFMEKVISYGVQKIDLKSNKLPPEIKVLESRFKDKYNKTIEQLEQATLVKILAIMYQVKQRTLNSNYSFNSDEQNKFCATMLKLRQKNDKLHNWLPPRKSSGNLFNDYSKNIKPAYENNNDTYIMGKNSFYVKADIKEIAECFSNKANGVNEVLEQPYIVPQFAPYSHDRLYDDAELPTFGRSKSANQGLLDHY